MSEQTRTEKKLLHYMSKAIREYNMIEAGDRVMLCLSGGKDSYSMVNLMQQYRRMRHCDFDIFVFTLDQAQPGWDDRGLRSWLEHKQLPYTVLRKDTYSIVKQKIPEGKTYCSLCSRLRRGNIYRFAQEQGYNKIALGHHRDDLIVTLLLSIFYNGVIRSMPPKLLSDDKQHIVIRPLAYVQEKDLVHYAAEQQFPIIPCTLCGSQGNLKRAQMKTWLQKFAQDNPKIPSNILHALGHVQPSQLMDKKLWDFVHLKSENTLEAPEIKEAAVASDFSNTFENQEIFLDLFQHDLGDANSCAEESTLENAEFSFSIERLKAKKKSDAESVHP